MVSTATKASTPKLLAGYARGVTTDVGGVSRRGASGPSAFAAAVSAWFMSNASKGPLFTGLSSNWGG